MMEVVSGDNWSYKTCKAPVKSSSSTNQHPTFYRPDALPVAQPSVKALKCVLLLFYYYRFWVFFSPGLFFPEISAS